MSVCLTCNLTFEDDRAFCSNCGSQSAVPDNESETDFRYLGLPERHDPLEDDPEIKKIIDAAREEATATVSQRHSPRLGFCQVVWQVQKKILKEKYGIDWKSPQQMNPHKRYD